jgi:hypothetical protein
MSRKVIGRRDFLTLPLALLLSPLVSPLLSPPRRAYGAVEAHSAPYRVEVSLLYGVLTYRIDETLAESVDRAAGRYEVEMTGDGDGIANRIESTGVLRQGRWAPLRSRSFFSVKGRESRADITYDYDAGKVDYHFKGETFFLRRLRVVDDVVPMPEGVLVDDAISATLNYADQLWRPQADGDLLTHIVRRKMASNEGPDDVQAQYRAELAPLTLKVAVDAETRKPIARFDLTRFSSWAKQNQPALITFGGDRRPERMSLPMILGTSVQISLKTD